MTKRKKSTASSASPVVETELAVADVEATSGPRGGRKRTRAAAPAGRRGAKRAAAEPELAEGAAADEAASAPDADATSAPDVDAASAPDEAAASAPEAAATDEAAPMREPAMTLPDTEGAASDDDASPSSAPPSEGAADVREPLDADTHHDAADDDSLDDAETTVNLSGDLRFPGRDDLDEPTVAMGGDAAVAMDGALVQRAHLRGLLEALVFASDAPIKTNELAKHASAPLKQVKELLAELRTDYLARGIHLDEVAGGWVFRTNAQYAPFVRDLTKQKPVRLSRAQVETLAIIAYRQPITRPEIDDVRGVDSGPVLKVLLERDLVRILGKRDEPGRPLIYGTTNAFLEFFGLKSLKDLPTLREFTELTDESRQAYEDELGEPPDAADAAMLDEGAAPEGDAAPDAPEDEVAAADAAEREAEIDADERDAEGAAEPGARAPRESMRVPAGEQPIDDLGDDDLEPISEASPEVAGSDAPPSDDESAPHAADLDDPTLTTDAPDLDDEHEPRDT